VPVRRSVVSKSWSLTASSLQEEGDAARRIAWRRKWMATERGTGGSTGGIGLGGVLVIVGIVLMIVWSFWVGLIVALVGLVAFGGFAKGKWY
jgi:hypothetical protein